MDVGTPYKKSIPPWMAWYTSRLPGCKAIHNISSFHNIISNNFIPVIFL